jgi:hypothetical protein
MKRTIVIAAEAKIRPTKVSARTRMPIVAPFVDTLLVSQHSWAVLSSRRVE